MRYSQQNGAAHSISAATTAGKTSRGEVINPKTVLFGPGLLRKVAANWLYPARGAFKGPHRFEGGWHNGHDHEDRESDAPRRKSVNAWIFRSEEDDCREIKEHDAGEEVVGPGLRLDQRSDTACRTCDCQGLRKGRNLRALLAGQIADPQQHGGGSQENERRAQNLLHRAVV